jgi:hypothetical protein
MYSNRLFNELKPLICSAYKRDDLTPEHMLYETWGVTLRQLAEPHEIVACSTLSFTFSVPSYFQTRFEAVHPDQQRTGLGKLLYDCITVWTRFLLLNDPLVTDGVIRSDGDYCLVSFIDAPECTDPVIDPERDGWDSVDYPDENEAGHGAFLKKLGFVRAQHDFGQDNYTEIAYQLAFHAPIEEWLSVQE